MKKSIYNRIGGTLLTLGVIDKREANFMLFFSCRHLGGCFFV